MGARTRTNRADSKTPPADQTGAAVARHGKLSPRRHEELPPPWLAEERANERGANHGNPFVEKSTGAGDEDAGRRGGDVAAEGVRVGAETDRAAAWMQPSHS